MKIDRNDPRLTAYVLGELDGEERLQIEAALRESAELQDEVEEIRAASELLESAFSAREGLVLNPEQVEEIEGRLASGGETASGLLQVPWMKIAVLLILLVGIPLLVSSRIFVLGPEREDVIGLLGPTSSSDAGSRRSSGEAETSPREIAGNEEAQGSQLVKRDRETSAVERSSVPNSEAPASAPRKRPQEAEPERAKLADQTASANPQQPATPPAESGALNRQAKARLVPLPVGVARGQSAPPIQGRESFDLIQPTAKTPQEVASGGKRIESLSSASVGYLDRRQLLPPFHTEGYDRIVSNDFKRVLDNPLSTFSIDVDTATYANMRRFIRQGSLPPPDAVRIEELINYFNYEYPQPTDGHPFSVNLEAATAPWAPEHRLLRIGLKGRELQGDRPTANLVFLIDVSGSMSPPNKLPLLQQAMKLLVDRLRPSDRVAIAVYAGASGLVLPSTPGSRKAEILESLDRLQAGGSTNGAAGIELAYSLALSNRIQGGINRVILATDGDFNVGVTDRGSLTRLIEEKAKQGIFLSVLGFGMGNLKDSTLEQLADKGNGNYGYIDTLQEARKLLVEQMDGTLVTIAKDVKIQVEFNPAQVEAYRLIGYENRALANEDFNDDKKDAGEIGAGHTVTALYEVVPAGGAVPTAGVDPLRYQQPVRHLSEAARSGEMVTVKLRYKRPEEDASQLLTVPFVDPAESWSAASRDFKFAAAVASFGMLLRDSPYKGSSSFGSVLELARESGTLDAQGYRAEFLELVQAARRLSGQ